MTFSLHHDVYSYHQEARPSSTYLAQDRVNSDSRETQALIRQSSAARTPVTWPQVQRRLIVIYNYHFLWYQFVARLTIVASFMLKPTRVSALSINFLTEIVYIYIYIYIYMIWREKGDILYTFATYYDVINNKKSDKVHKKHCQENWTNQFGGLFGGG